MRKSKRFLRQSADGGITAEVNAHRCGIFPEKESRFGRHFFSGKSVFWTQNLTQKPRKAEKNGLTVIMRVRISMGVCRPAV